MTLVCSISLIIALLTASLLPTDVILVSFMKNSNGTFKVRDEKKLNCGQLSFRNGHKIKQREMIFKNMLKLDIMVSESHSSVE